MGEFADYRLNGDDCQVCGVPFADAGEGFPRTCAGCGADDARLRPPRAKRVACPGCARKFPSHFALSQHRTAKGH